MPSKIKKLANYAKAVVKHTADGFKNVPKEVYEERMAICDECPLNKEGECGLCGCPLESKALWASESCPDKKWPAKTKKIGFSANNAEKPTGNRDKCDKCGNRH